MVTYIDGNPIQLVIINLNTWNILIQQLFAKICLVLLTSPKKVLLTCLSDVTTLPHVHIDMI
jgi:hypothetical protein